MRVPFMSTPEGKLPDSEHTSLPWRIHEIAADFRLEDVWALPTPGGPDDFGLLVEHFATGDPGQEGSIVSRLLWSIRWRLGALLGWDDPQTGLGSRVPTLRRRLPPDLLEGPRGPQFGDLPFEPLYLLEDEFAAEIANQTVHGILHLSWVEDPAGGYRGQLAVLVKPNGLLGALYMAAINPFRYVVVYPALLRQVAADWRARGPARPA